MAYEATVPVHRRLLWSALTDPERLLGAVPNLVVEASTEQGVAARLRLRVGDRSITFRGIARLVELAPDQLRAVLELEAAHGRSDGAIDGRVEFRLLAAGGGTRIVVTPDLELSGRAPTIPAERLAEAGQRLIPRWFQQLANTSPDSRQSPVTLTVVPDTESSTPAPQTAPAPNSPPSTTGAEPPHGPTLTLITGNAENASPSPAAKVPLRLVQDAGHEADLEPAAEADLWSRGRGPLLAAPLWVFAAAAAGLFGLAALLLRRALRRR